jgi:acetolactate synthase I/II/III large subunit
MESGMSQTSERSTEGPARTLTGADLVIRLLRRYGVDTAFGLSGNGVLGLFDAALEHGLRIIDARHESAAVHAAGGRAQILRAPQVCIVTEGPGLSNAMGAIAAMNHDGVPIVVITNCEDDRTFGTGAFQEMPQVAMTSAISKWSTKVHDVAHLPEVIARAFRQAHGDVPGTVVITVANHVLLGPAELALAGEREPSFSRPTAGTYPSPEFVEASLALLRAAERPLLLLGAMAYWDRGDELALRLVETLRIPTGAVDIARGLIPDDHPCSIGDGRPGALPSRLRDADVVFVLGERLDYLLGFGRPWKPDTRFIQAYPDVAQIGRSIDTHVSTTASTCGVIEALLTALGEGAWAETAWGRSAREDYLRLRSDGQVIAAAGKGEGVHPGVVARTAQDVVGPGAIMVLDGANCLLWAKRFLDVQAADRHLEWGRLGMIGMGLPYSLGAKSAQPDRTVILIVGDGSLGFYFMEFETALRHDLPVVVVVCNDSAWGIEQHFQRGVFGRTTGTSLTPARYDRMAEALGGFGAHVERPEDLAPALRAAIASQRPAIVNVRTLDVADPVTAAATRMLRKKHDR